MGRALPPAWQVLVLTLLLSLCLGSLETWVPYSVPADQAAHGLSGARPRGRSTPKEPSSYLSREYGLAALRLRQGRPPRA